MGAFKIPEVVMPTEEELFEVCSAKYAQVAHTYIDHWPPELLALSMPTTLVPVDATDMCNLFEDGPVHLVAADKIASTLDGAMGWREWFVRLNSRSPKDMTAPGIPVTCSGKQAVFWLGGSERVLDDTSMMFHAKKPMFICLREWVHMPPGDEWRCFAKGGELIAVSRYFYDRTDFAPDSDKRLWEAANAFYRAHLASGYPDIVFDLLAPGTSRELLIEINPYGMSDPCLFGNYEAIETEGGVRQHRLNVSSPLTNALPPECEQGVAVEIMSASTASPAEQAPISLKEADRGNAG